MAFDVSIEIGIVEIVLAVGAVFLFGARQIMRFFDWLESILPAKLMFVAFGIAFALCALLQIRGLDPSYPIPQLQSVFQWASLAWFAGAMLSCVLAVLVTLGDGAIKYANRTRYYYVEYPYSNDRRF